MIARRLVDRQLAKSGWLEIGAFEVGAAEARKIAALNAGRQGLKGKSSVVVDLHTQIRWRRDG